MSAVRIINLPKFLFQLIAGIRINKIYSFKPTNFFFKGFLLFAHPSAVVGFEIAQKNFDLIKHLSFHSTKAIFNFSCDYV